MGLRTKFNLVILAAFAVGFVVAALVLHRVFNTGAGTLELVVVAGVMLVPLLPRWPTASPYEVFEGSSSAEHPPQTGA